MRAEIVDITPQLAEKWLGSNYNHNRKIRKSYVSQLAEVMKSGRYMPENGQTIVIGEDGVLYDGQHRLSAIAESGTTQRMIVAYVDDGERAYMTIDNGTKRTASDFLSEFKNKPSCAAYGKIMACVEWSSVPLLSCLQGKWNTHAAVDRDLIIAYCNANAESTQDSVNKSRAMRRAIGCGSVSMYSAFIGVVRYCGTDDFLEEFIVDFCSLVPESKTAIAVKSTITRMNNKNTAMTNRWLFGTLLDAYTHYREMDDSVMFNKHLSRIKQYSKLVDNVRAIKSGVADKPTDDRAACDEAGR